MTFPTSSTVPTTFFNLLSHSKPPLSCSLLLLLISSDIHPNPGPINFCSVCSRRVTRRNRSVQCTNCFLWVYLSCFGLSPTDFQKIFPGHSWTCPMCPSSFSHSNLVSSSTNTQKLSSSNMNPPKTSLHH